MQGVDDTVDMVVVSTIVDELNADARNMRHIYPYNYLVAQGVLPAGLDHEQQKAFYNCFAAKVNATYATMDQFFNAILACVHSTEDEMRTELYTVVDQGGIVVDVAVENSLYGELRGNLNLASRYDVDNFIQQAKDTPEALLSRMTGGVHLHTLHCPDAGSFERIKKELEEKGILYRKE